MKQNTKSEKRWKPNRGEIYYRIEEDGYIEDYYWDGENFDKNNFSTHNCWQNYEEAERCKKIRDAFQWASFEPDWKDLKETKYFIYYDCECENLQIGQTKTNNYGLSFYFEKYQVAEVLIQKYSRIDIATFILNMFN